MDCAYTNTTQASLIESSRKQSWIKKYIVEELATLIGRIVLFFFFLMIIGRIVFVSTE